MASWRRIPAHLRFDDFLAILSTSALLILGIRYSPYLDGGAFARFLGLVLYYSGAFLLARRLTAAPGPANRHKPLVLGASMLAVASFALIGDYASPVASIKNLVVLELPFLAGVGARLVSTRSHRSYRGTLLRDFAPYLISQAAYLLMHGLVHAINPVDRDPWLILADERLFGGAWTQWVQPLVSPWLTEWFSVAYSLYVFFPLGLALWFVARSERDPLINLLQAVVLCTYLGYLGYLLVPAIGPMYTLTYEVPLKGGWFSQVRESLDTLARVPRDCFPSLHTANTVVVLWMVWRHARPLRWVFALLGGSCILATIYLRYHYTVDVAAGLALGIGVAVWTPRLAHAWNRAMEAILRKLETTPGSRAMGG